MKFKNVTGKVIHMKVDNEWNSIEPGKCVDLPEYVGVRQVGLVLESVKEKKEKVEELEKEVPKKPDKLSKDDLEKLNKDQLNDHAAIIGFKEVNTKMRKAKMINAILKFQDNEME